MIDRNLHLQLTSMNRHNSIMKDDHLNFMFDCLVFPFQLLTCFQIFFTWQLILLIREL